MVPAHGGRAAEPVYRPVLVGRRGELEALAHLDAAAVPLLAPVIDVHTVDACTVDLLGRLPAGLLPAVDVSALPEAPQGEPVRWGVPLVPVIGLAESSRRLVTHGAAARAYAQRAVVRLRTGQDRAGPDATGAVERVWRLTRLVPEECDLLVDAGDVCCPADVRLAEPRVRRLLEWARRHAWRSVTVAAGGMPPTLARLPTDEPARLDRFDWQLWRRLADLDVGYGDYGVGCAAPGADGPGDRLPTLRYTTDGAWWIYRWSRRGGRGDERFADMCRTLVSAPWWPASGASFSWGDHEILRRARRGAGAGSPANWIAWSTSHHLAHVLAALRQPEREQRGGPWRDGQDAAERRAGRSQRGGESRRAG
ncbi:hypothetical protein Q2K19_04900 [Micromonospora soli]|uniref:beta family protein n=1 Tax=Micromonospora sp. NBRC 110009 TaxID=3061627 RepID=UPI002672DAED|nr:hypothetical protein [Micromonospora sp. NBRC 110009]WKT99832.1 hypothetical protein Q2K19_04900 [Micromonospora sp. NBRC 110009]